MPLGVMAWRVLAVLGLAVLPTSQHVTWTPILPDSPDQVDLWTKSGSGCACPHRAPSHPRHCACCVARVACHCGQANPHRCGQCGLQHFCNNMCNMTIDGGMLSVTSGRLSGSLVSPLDLAPPTLCWYRLRAPPGHRVEVQLHRLVHVGTLVNTTMCRGGSVEVRGGGAGEPSLTLCGEDERLHPPAVLYSDSGHAIITYKVSQEWGSPRFIAYYNFPHKNDDETGDLQRGGSRLEYTACDWLYEDVDCSRAGGCQLTSPGYPGLYPAPARCRYLLVMSSPDTRGRLTFRSLDLHPQRCSTDYVAVYAGTSTSSPLIDSLCGSQTRTIRFSGPSVLVDFSSGPRVPQYKYSGFLATVTFTGVVGVPSLPSTPLPRTPALSDTGAKAGTGRECDRVFTSNVTREGIFDTSAIAPGNPSCCLRFIGHEDEVVQVSLFKYNLGGRNCQSDASIYDGLTDDPGDNLLRRLCGPLNREPRDATGRFLQQEFFLSSANTLEIRLNLGSQTNFLSQYLVGGYHFHNSRQEGTKNPGSVCDVMFYGASTPRRGSLHRPSTTLLWNVEGPLNCSFLFVPTASQSLAITVREGVSRATQAHCSTECGEDGCQCQPSMVALTHVDHILLLHTHTHNVIACLCGDMTEERRVVVEAGHGGVDVIYHVAHFTWATPGFNFTLDYNFAPATICGPAYYKTPSGEVGPREYTTAATTQLYVTCRWVLASPPGAALALTVSPPSQGSCATWNLSVESAGREKSEILRAGSCAGEDTALFDIPAHHLAATLTLELRGAHRHDWLITWNTHWPPRLPPTTSVSPKPELSRTSDLHPTRKIYLVQSGSGSSVRADWLGLLAVLPPLLLLLLLPQLLLISSPVLRHLPRLAPQFPTPVPH